MAAYLNAVINSVMAEGDKVSLSKEEHLALLRLKDTLNAYNDGTAITSEFKEWSKWL